MLEVGFGGGELIANIEPFVPEGSVAGVDFSPDMVAAGDKRFASLFSGDGWSFARARAEELPYADGRFTKACTVNTVYFWPDPGVPLRELWRVLRPGGRLAVSFSVPAAIQRLPFTKHGFTLYEPDRISETPPGRGVRRHPHGPRHRAARGLHVRDRDESRLDPRDETTPTDRSYR